VAAQLATTEARQRQPERGGELTRERLHLSDDPRGKNRAADRCGDAPPAR
jgi:hypothetical protein